MSFCTRFFACSLRNLQMCDQVDSKDIFMWKYCPGRYKIKEMCDKAAGSSLPTP